MWWNPNKWFVWYIDQYKWRDALQYKYEWYWVYEKPIQDLFSKYQIKSKIINKNNYNNSFSKKDHLKTLLIELNNWNFIQLWWDYCTTPNIDDWIIKLKSNQKLTKEQIKKWINAKNICYKDWNYNRQIIWYYLENEKYIEIKWLNWEHAFYLLWYKWWIENPTHIIVWDTYTWKHIYSIKEWLRKWELVENRSLIIYK
jgi:hypothetical protein